MQNRTFIIAWSKTAKDDFLQIIDYILLKFGKTAAIKFQDNVEHNIVLISKMPYIFLKSDFSENFGSFQRNCR